MEVRLLGLSTDTGTGKMHFVKHHLPSIVNVLKCSALLLTNPGEKRTTNEGVEIEN